MAKTKEKILARLEQLQSKEPSKWVEESTKERENRSWLRHSQYIAVIVLGKLRELNMTQKDLAEKLGCSQQYVSKIVKGKENLSLETITKLEDALQVSFFASQYGYFLNKDKPDMVADDNPCEYEHEAK